MKITYIFIFLFLFGMIHAQSIQDLSLLKDNIVKSNSSSANMLAFPAISHELITQTQYINSTWKDVDQALSYDFNFKSSNVKNVHLYIWDTWVHDKTILINSTYDCNYSGVIDEKTNKTICWEWKEKVIQENYSAWKELSAGSVSSKDEINFLPSAISAKTDGLHQFKLVYDTPINSQGEFLVNIKDESSKIVATLDPWYDSSWWACQDANVSITQANTTFNFTLDNSNFDYSRANADLSDLRVLEGSCLEPNETVGVLPMWIEDVNTSSYSHLWVKATNPITSIAVYFNNSDASSISDPNGGVFKQFLNASNTSNIGSGCTSVTSYLDALRIVTDSSDQYCKITPDFSITTNASIVTKYSFQVYKNFIWPVQSDMDHLFSKFYAGGYFDDNGGAGCSDGMACWASAIDEGTTSSSSVYINKMNIFWGADGSNNTLWNATGIQGYSNFTSGRYYGSGVNTFTSIYFGDGDHISSSDLRIKYLAIMNYFPDNIELEWNPPQVNLFINLTSPADDYYTDYPIEIASTFHSPPDDCWYILNDAENLTGVLASDSLSCTYNLTDSLNDSRSNFTITAWANFNETLNNTEQYVFNKNSTFQYPTPPDGQVLDFPYLFTVWDYNFDNVGSCLLSIINISNYTGELPNFTGTVIYGSGCQTNLSLSTGLNISYVGYLNTTNGAWISTEERSVCYESCEGGTYTPPTVDNETEEETGGSIASNPSGWGTPSTQGLGSSSTSQTPPGDSSSAQVINVPSEPITNPVSSVIHQLYEPPNNKEPIIAEFIEQKTDGLFSISMPNTILKDNSFTVLLSEYQGLASLYFKFPVFELLNFGYVFIIMSFYGIIWSFKGTQRYNNKTSTGLMVMFFGFFIVTIFTMLLNETIIWFFIKLMQGG